jgi:hypothetical protein
MIRRAEPGLWTSTSPTSSIVSVPKRVAILSRASHQSNTATPSKMASSPAHSRYSDEDATADQKKQEQITFLFCSECSNMLYPKEDPDSRRLQFVCRTCNFTDKATSSCIFRNVLNNAAGETAGVTQDVGSDPTVRTAWP